MEFKDKILSGHIPSKPDFRFNGCPVFKGYYLNSPNMEWDEFCLYILNHEIDLYMAEKNFQYYDYSQGFDPKAGICNWELKQKTIKDLEYFDALVNDGVIGVLPD